MKGYGDLATSILCYFNVNFMPEVFGEFFDAFFNVFWKFLLLSVLFWFFRRVVYFLYERFCRADGQLIFNNFLIDI
jgi:hypothetical protein